MLLLSMAAGCAPEATDPQAPRPGETVSQTWHRLLEIDPPRQRTAALARFLTTLGPGDVDAVSAILFDFHRRQRAVDDLLLVNALAELSPVKAAQEAIALKLPYGEPSHADVVLEWARADPIAATAKTPLKTPSRTVAGTSAGMPNGPIRDIEASAVADPIQPAITQALSDPIRNPVATIPTISMPMKTPPFCAPESCVD